MINPTDPPTDQQIHHFKPTINRSQPIDPNLARRSTTNDPLQPQHTSVTTQPRPKHRTQPQPQPTTPLSTGHSQKKKINHHSDPRQKPQPPLIHAVTHDPNIRPTAQSRTTTNDPNTGPNREGRERRDGVWVWIEKRAKKEEREKNWSTELVEREISEWNKIYIYFLEYCYSTMLNYSTILTLELYCSTIAKKFAILGFTVFWCTRFWAMKCQKCLRYGISILQC